MSTALEYTVDANGHVSTKGTYREITQAQWETLAPPPRRWHTRYGPALDAVARGKVIAFAAPTSKAAWTIRRSVILAAARRGLAIETRRASDPDVEGGQLVLVRAQQR